MLTASWKVTRLTTTTSSVHSLKEEPCSQTATCLYLERLLERLGRSTTAQMTTELEAVSGEPVSDTCRRPLSHTSDRKSTPLCGNQELTL